MRQNEQLTMASSLVSSSLPNDTISGDMTLPFVPTPGDQRPGTDDVCFGVSGAKYAGNKRWWDDVAIARKMYDSFSDDVCAFVRKRDRGRKYWIRVKHEGGQKSWELADDKQIREKIFSRFRHQTRKNLEQQQREGGAAEPPLLERVTVEDVEDVRPMTPALVVQNPPHISEPGTDNEDDSRGSAPPSPQCNRDTVATMCVQAAKLQETSHFINHQELGEVYELIHSLHAQTKEHLDQLSARVCELEKENLYYRQQQQTSKRRRAAVSLDQEEMKLLRERDGAIGGALQQCAPTVLSVNVANVHDAEFASSHQRDNGETKNPLDGGGNGDDSLEPIPVAFSRNNVQGTDCQSNDWGTILQTQEEEEAAANLMNHAMGLDIIDMLMEDDSGFRSIMYNDMMENSEDDNESVVFRNFPWGGPSESGNASLGREKYRGSKDLLPRRIQAKGLRAFARGGREETPLASPLVLVLQRRPRSDFRRKPDQRNGDRHISADVVEKESDNTKTTRSVSPKSNCPPTQKQEQDCGAGSLRAAPRAPTLGPKQTGNAAFQPKEVVTFDTHSSCDNNGGKEDQEGVALRYKAQSSSVQIYSKGPTESKHNPSQGSPAASSLTSDNQHVDNEAIKAKTLLHRGAGAARQAVDIPKGLRDEDGLVRPFPSTHSDNGERNSGVPGASRGEGISSRGNAETLPPKTQINGASKNERTENQKAISEANNHGSCAVSLPKSPKEDICSENAALGAVGKGCKVEGLCVSSSEGDNDSCGSNDDDDDSCDSDYETLLYDDEPPVVPLRDGSEIPNDGATRQTLENEDDRRRRLYQEKVARDRRMLETAKSLWR